jgi:ABC-type lipoprotein release transport system permease subunit
MPSGPNVNIIFSVVMKNLMIAWRNLWRSKRRTLITISSVFFAVIISTLMSSMQEGSYGSMVDNWVKFYSGYMQIHQEGYWEDRTINNSFPETDSLFNLVKQTEGVTQITPRFVSFALASSKETTKGAMIMGVNPDGEDRVTGISKWITAGRYLQSGDNGLLVASGLLKHLGLNVSDTLVLLGQGYHGVSAAGKYPITGVLEFPNPEINQELIYMEINNCREFYSAESLLTSFVVMVKDQYSLPGTYETLQEKIISPYSLMRWDEMHPEVVQMISADRAGGVFMKAILYILVGFGIFGTILMMLSERKREMGVMVAIGMQRSKLGVILLFETILIGLMGVLVGFAGSVPVIAYFVKHPVVLTGDAAATMVQMGIEPLLLFSWLPSVFYNQVIIVFIITALIAIYPVYRSGVLRVNLALRA